MKHRHFRSLLILFSLIVLGGCGSSGIQTTTNGSNPNPNSNNSEPSQTTAESFASALVQINFFNLGSDFPPALVIPDVPGMEGTAFVVTFTPTAVIPVDLETGQVSAKFSIFDASTLAEAAFPNSLVITSPDRGYLLGATHVVVFNPSTGQLLGSVDLTESINLTSSLPYSQAGDCNFDSIPESSVGPGPFNPSFPAAIAVVGQRLFVTMSNACFDAAFESFYVQGLLRVYDIQAGAPYLTKAVKPFLVLPGFNATALTVFNDRLFVTSTGDTSLQGSVNIPQSDSFISEVNPQSLGIVNQVNLGKVGANYQALAIDGDQELAYVGSAAYSQVYQLNLNPLQILRGGSDPIVVSNVPDDYITDQEMAWGSEVLFLSSFNQSAVLGLDLTADNFPVLPQVLDFSFPNNPGVTGAGPMALRPGQPGLDFGGPDLWVLTSNPGSLSHATTY